jgi:hypothetical protein
MKMFWDESIHILNENLPGIEDVDYARVLGKIDGGILKSILRKWNHYAKSSLHLSKEGSACYAV